MLPGGASAKAKKAPKKDIGIQLYSVRSLIGVFGKSQGDYKPVLKQLADMGYTSVEAASYKDGMLYGQTPEQFRKDVEDAGMRVISTHCTLNLSDEELASGEHVATTVIFAVRRERFNQNHERLAHAFETFPAKNETSYEDVRAHEEAAQAQAHKDDDDDDWRAYLK